MGTPSFMDTRIRLTGFEGPAKPYMPEDIDGVLPVLTDFGEAGNVLMPSNTSREISYRPERITATRSASRIASVMSWVIMIVVSPSFLCKAR